jgi:hypothetical protein
MYDNSLFRFIVNYSTGVAAGLILGWLWWGKRRKENEAMSEALYLARWSLEVIAGESSGVNNLARNIKEAKRALRVTAEIMDGVKK